ncbi:MAG: RNA polymerase factor sigma-32 [Deltaproteobacteria bacterium]|jgi:RNA polymerase sigma-32 factor|nr:RNA polymerase factor sigma-32 [Deltaproteobacteria bacterium]MBT6432571.1 RNA polymerase factor sigma-32 [Deltaproteobacteria bacterium]MBT6489313.1 RNA polymerase factor sigma-32 [Deltaproteobacteria bacterium]
MANSTALTISENNIDSYMAEVSRHPLLSRDEEMSLAYAFRDDGDVSAAHRMVVGNLRFVVKIAHEYRHYGLKKLDLIQEGNMGLMMAVKKFDPDRGYRLISYAVWWIRAQIQSFIQRSWSMVKVGMTGSRRKLFFKLRSERALLEKNALPGEKPTNADIAKHLGVSEADVDAMEVVMAGRDFSLDTTLTDESGTSHLDLLADENASQEEYVAQLEEHQVVREKLAEVAADSNEKEQYIIEHRLLDEEPMSLQEIGTHFGVSRERIRQLESRVMGKLKLSLEGLRPSPQA